MKGLTWLVLRQHRAVLGLALVLTAAFAGYLVHQRFDMLALFDEHAIRSCAPAPAECMDDARDRLVAPARSTLLDTGRALLAIPVLLGTFVGAPLFARELESGTHRLVLAQSVGPRHWAAAKLALATSCALLVSVPLTAVYAWWWHPDYQKFHDLVWTYPVPFHTAGPAAVGLAVLGLLLGVTAGLLLRRTLLAMGTALAATAGLLYVADLEQVRRLWLSAVPRTSATGPVDQLPEIPRFAVSSWEDQGFLTRSGEWRPAEVCAGYQDAAMRACADRHGLARSVVEYHPPGHFWPMQWLMAGVCLAIAAALAAFVLWRIGRLTRAVR